MSDDFEAVRAMRPDRADEDAFAEPAVFTRERDRLMAAIGDAAEGASGQLRMPGLYPRLAYDDERAAVEYLVRVFQLAEIREARTEIGDNILAWLRVGTAVVMIGKADEAVHRIRSPRSLGGTTVQLMTYVDDIDAHYGHAVRAGADITMPIEDAFYGERRYEATDLEGHRWHFAERFADIEARGGIVAEDPTGGLR
jgi:PhnB protein